MINIAELLKDAPKGMKLYSPLFGEVEFVRIDKQSDYPIDVIDCKGNGKSFTEFGVYFADHPDAECLLFPSKEVRTWEGWKAPVENKFKVGNWIVRNNGSSDIPIQVYGLKKDRYLVTNMLGSKGEVMLTCQDKWHLWTIEDAKDGDVLVTTKTRKCPFIYRMTGYDNDLAYYYAGIDGNGDFCEGCIKRTLYHFGPVANVAPATKEQCDLLFRKMKEAGYTWDADKKELRKIKSHYDISNFQPFDKVLVRFADADTWRCTFFSHYIRGPYAFFCTDCTAYQCIPYNDDTKHLLGTTDMPSAEYINW